MAGLNDMQDLACRHMDGPLLILAGAGSGKTRVITHRVAYLMDEMGVNPYNILAITFTNKAASEMRERVNQIVGEGAERVWVSTFHSLCVRILRRFAHCLDYEDNFNIYDSDDQKAAMKNILKELQIDSKKYPEKMFMAEISRAKEQYLTPDEYEKNNITNYHGTQVAKVYRAYEERLKKYNAMDFDDLIFNAVQLFEHHPDVLALYQDRFRYIMVDEYQDTNHIQFLFVKLLARKYRNICVVGDDDQSIYKFRGANIANILNFEDVYPDARVIKLEQNYRSAGNILDAANAVIKHNAGRKDKALWTDKEKGEKICLRQVDDEFIEADYIANEIVRLVASGARYSDIAILYRTNAQSRVLGEKLVMRGLPHRVYGGQNFYDRKEIKDILAYLKVIHNDADATYLRRIINVPKRGIGDASVDKVAIYAGQEDISLMEALRRVDEIASVSRASAKIKSFVGLIDKFQEMIAQKENLSTVFDRILEDTGYEEELVAEHTDESMARLENIDELRNRVIQYEMEHEEASLAEFLADTALVSELDKLSEDDNAISLMTLHSAKGLEFPYVFISGMEERLFPSSMALDSEDPDALEEERRLCYVGITRAMNKLYLTCTRSRMQRGSRNYNEVSRFLREIPEELFEDYGDVRRSNRKTMERRYMDGEYKASNGTKAYPFGERQKLSTAYGSSKPSFGKEFVVNRELVLDYAEGDRVRHIKFGEGTVVSLVKGGKDYEVTVNFDRCGIRKMFASFAKLKKLDG